ncbi:MAG: VCBS repeat-containing protein [Bacteroidetes bacterium]|nr:VCBS repeat-containing protein [Bacteroidota bacterium]
MDKKSSTPTSPYFAAAALFILVTSCGESAEPGMHSDKDSVLHSMHFETLTPAQSGIDFTNTIVETDSFNYFNYEYIYNGGGVAVGDINNDGLTDIYFTGNQVPDKLYLNKGAMKFEDITATAIGVKAGSGWRTGVVMADVNADGFLDIYVSRSACPDQDTLRSNLLYINNGNLTFTEQARQYGIDSERPTTQSAFFDYDNDGDLDLYVMNHPFQTGRTQSVSVAEIETYAQAGSAFSDQLFRNDNGLFTDVSAAAGIKNHAFGLGLAVADVDNNGYEDLYISNDYMAPDYLYMNNGNGTFSEEIKTRTGHISSFSMGNDIADFNNDGFLDIITLDMVSEDHIRSKKNMGGMSTEKFWNVVRAGYHYQYMFNALQLNNGNGTFSDVAQLAGVAKTDWSWAPLFADFDNDGFNDLFVTNGYRRDARDNDFLLETKKRDGNFADYEEALELMPATKIRNYMFQNTGDLHFNKVMDEWGFDQPVNSNGAAYADFDNDGDLDLVVNNMDEVSFVMQNELKTSNHFLKLKIKGSEKNKFACGAKIKLQTSSGIQFKTVQLTRGYQSGVDPVLHFGLGAVSVVELVEVYFADGKKIERKNIQADQLLELNYADAVPAEMTAPANQPLFVNDAGKKIKHRHQEIFADDFEREILMPHKMSQLGPFMSGGDVNGDKLEDFYVSGSLGFAGTLYKQNASGDFVKQPGPWEKEKNREELGSAFIDVENDGDLDLYVVSGSNEYMYNSTFMMDQLYINDGTGKFVNETATRLPLMETSGQRIAVGDYDNDGYQDIFVGGRQTPGFYPFAPRSYLLHNNKGVFEDVTSTSPDLMGPGLITESLFDDFDADGDLDLVCVGEWMPVSMFENKEGIFTNTTAKYNLQKSVGWWTSVSKGDFNGDGKNDYVVGNIGENNKFHPSESHPLEIYCHDFDGNGSYDIVLGEYQNGVCYPVRGRQCSSQQMPFIQEKFPTYNEFAVADLEKIYGKENLEKALHYSATTFSSALLLSDGGGFRLVNLPVLAQLGPLNKTILKDINADGKLDIIGAGNNFAAEVETIRYDGGRGIVLLGRGDGTFEALNPVESGFFVDGDVKDLLWINQTLIVSENNGEIHCFDKK